MYHHVDVGRVVQDYLFLNGQKVGILNNSSTLFFYSADHLGSSEFLTDATGTATDFRDFKPYGTLALDQTNTSVFNDDRFTGKEKDPETSLQYYGARYLSNSLARFNTVDPLLLDDGRIVKKLIDPQQLNTYAYGRSNPLTFKDDDGNEIFSAILFTSIILGGLALAQPALAPTQQSNVNQAHESKGFWEVASPQYDAVPEWQKFAFSIGVFGTVSSLGKSTEKLFIKGINTWIARDAAEAASTNAIKNVWYNATFGSTEEAILKHYDKHVVQEGIEKSLTEYTKDARNFWRQYRDLIGKNVSDLKVNKPQSLGDGSIGYKLKDSSGMGGIFDKLGNIVSFWYK